MQKSKRATETRQSSVSFIIYTILGLVILAAIGMPVLQSEYIYPRFIRLIIETTEREAIRTGRHMMRTVLENYSGGVLVISEDIRTYLDNTSEDYDLWKVKIFSKSGMTLYSTDSKDVGKLNRHAYFHDNVAKGLVYTKVAQKNTKSLEDQIVANDVVETYIPILDKGEFIGAFELYYNITIRKESMDAIIARTNVLLFSLTGIIIIVALGAAIGIRHGMGKRKQYEDSLYSMATRDTLTGLYNRWRFIELLEWEVEKHNRYQKKTSLLMFDIDHFKTVNDTYGHQTGDKVLVAVSETCKQALRESDLLARYGGEEFVALLPETAKADAIGVAEKIRQAVEAMIVPNTAGPIQVTISVGVADFREIETLNLDAAIKLADDCLYHAKFCGRNRVCTSDQLNSIDNSIPPLSASHGYDK